MPKSDAQKRATAKYNAKAYEKIDLRLYKGDRELLQARATELNKSMNQYLLDLLATDIPEIRH